MLKVKILFAVVIIIMQIAAISNDKIETSLLKMESQGRCVFVRLEPKATFKLYIFNNSKNPLMDGSLVVSLNGIDFLDSSKIMLPPIPAGQSYAVEIPIETNLQPQSYKLKVKCTGKSNNKDVTEDWQQTVFIVAKPKDIMPVIMWGNGKLDEIKKVGFTHQLINLGSAPSKEPTTHELRKHYQELDLYLKYQVSAINRSGIGYLTDKYPRVNRHGQVYPRKNLDAANPDAANILCKTAEEISERYGWHPAFESVMINTEVRDKTNPSFSGYEQAAFKKLTGKDIPTQINSRWSIGYQSIPGFPELRVIPDDYPLLVYYKWFWKEGDGWPALNGNISKSFHKHLSPDKKFWSFNDPAVRVPPIWGSGGNVDCISHWTYTYPDPLKIAQVTDELRAMADGKPGQMIMKMTQAIWYRSQVAPGSNVSNPPLWLKECPDARFISIAPDNLRESFWLMIARRLDGIMYHGYQSLVEKSPHASYCFTNAESRNVLAELTKNVVLPLGPLLKIIPEKSSEIAILESFTTAIFATKQHSFGWGGSWSANFHMALQWAHYQPDILYEEHILRGDLNKVKVLALIGCEVLPKSVFNAIIEFQRKGGIVIGDEFLVPGILPDISVKSFTYDLDRPAWSKQQLQKIGAEVRKTLAPFYESPASFDNQDIIVRIRSYHETDYLFIINDNRTFGEYVGQWRKVMEQGVSCKGNVTLRTSGKTAYDLVKHKQIIIDSKGGKVNFPVELLPGDGQLIMLLAEPIEKIELKVPGFVKCGNSFRFDIKVTDAKGNSVDALLPFKLTLLDA